MVDSISQEVYGHIVASDIFGEAYIIPFEAAFQDIQKKLGMKAVSLPTPRDVVDWVHLHHDMSSSVYSQDLSVQNSTDNIAKSICHGRKKSLPSASVLSDQELNDYLKDYQTGLGKSNVDEEWSKSDLSSKVSFPNMAAEGLQTLPLTYHRSTRKAPDDPRNTDDTRIIPGNKTLGLSKQATISPTFLSRWKIPQKIRESFKRVSSKLANVYTRTDKPNAMSERCSYCGQSSSHHSSQCILSVNYRVPVKLREPDGNDSGYGSTVPSPLSSPPKLAESDQ